MSKRNENAEMQLKIRAEVTENVNPINGQGNNNEKGDTRLIRVVK